MNRWQFFVLFLIAQMYAALLASHAAALPSSVSGPSIFDKSAITANAENKKGLVAIFLSSTCPCSNSHVEELKQLSRDFPEFSFVGIHSNTDEPEPSARAYFESLNLPFPVIKDSKTELADQFKALKTPHAFVVRADGSTAYQGGVSNSKEFSRADRKYLREALSDLKVNKHVRVSEGRALGCAISRGEL